MQIHLVAPLDRMVGTTLTQLEVIVGDEVVI